MDIQQQQAIAAIVQQVLAQQAQQNQPQFYPRDPNYNPTGLTFFEQQIPGTDDTVTRSYIQQQRIGSVDTVQELGGLTHGFATLPHLLNLVMGPSGLPPIDNTQGMYTVDSYFTRPNQQNFFG